MKISIVTPSFNQAEFLEETIQSVLNQRHDDLEYIVVDGGSSDGSLSIIEKYSSSLTSWISEPDSGQVEAVNKGMAMATGDICAYLNSDDLYLPGTLSLVAQYFADNPACRWVCGDVIFFGSGHTTLYHRSNPPKRLVDGLLWEFHAPQPAMFWRRSGLEISFDNSLNYCFDHDFYLRLLKSGITPHRLEQPLAAYRLHHSSKTVAMAEKFDLEFDLLTDRYLKDLDWYDRRKVDATTAVRIAFQRAIDRDSPSPGESALMLGRAMLLSPAIVTRRAWWGTLRQLLRSLLA